MIEHIPIKEITATNIFFLIIGNQKIENKTEETRHILLYDRVVLKFL